MGLKRIHAQQLADWVRLEGVVSDSLESRDQYVEPEVLVRKREVVHDDLDAAWVGWQVVADDEDVGAIRRRRTPMRAAQHRATIPSNAMQEGHFGAPTC